MAYSEAFKIICRICLDKDEPLISLYHKFGDFITYKKMLEECAQVQISNEDFLPKNVCLKCSIQLEQSYKLRIQCLISERILMKHNNKPSVAVKHEDYQIVESGEGTNVPEESSEEGDSNEDQNKILKEFKCTLCEIKLPTEEVFITHTEQEHGKPLYKCMQCGRFYLNKSVYQIHVYGHENRCRFCLEICKSPLDLARHVKNHEIKKEFPCPTCGLVLKSKGTFGRHFLNHSRSAIKTVCPYCGKAFKDSRYLEDHVGIHTGAKPYRCNFCDMKFVHRASVRSHMVTHIRERKYTCQICLKSFFRPQALRRHVLKHSEKKYSCSICNRMFHDNWDAKKHMLLHSGLKKFNCTLCTKSFARNYQLTSHLKTHSGIKPFECTECGKKFSERYLLNFHMKKHRDNSI